MTPSTAIPARRWPVISALGIVQIFAWGCSYYLLAVFAAPIAADTGWPLSWIVGGLSLGLFVAGLASPRVGQAIRLHGGKPVLALSALLLAAGLLILATAPVLPVFIAGWAVIGLGMGAGLYDAAFATLGGIYGHAARSAITSLTLLGGFASTLCWPLSAFLLDHLGWRWSCATYAAIEIGLCLPLILFALPGQRPTPDAAAGQAAPLHLSPDERHASRILMAIMVLSGLSVTIVSVHLLTILQGRGLTTAETVWLGALLGPAQVAARLFGMASGARHHPIRTMAAATGLGAVGLILLASGLPIIGAAIVLYGAGNGIFSIARGALPLTLFGPGRYAPVMGRLARPFLLAQAMAPTVGALLITTIGQENTLAFAAALAVADAALAGLLWQTIAAGNRAG